jgi:hypothetical protein
VKEVKIMSKETRLLNEPVSKGFIGSVAAVGLAAALSVGAATAHAQVAGSQTIGVSQEEMKLVATGWSAKKNILGKGVYNDKNEKIGTVDDLIIAPDKSVSFVIIGSGGFVGMGKHDGSR